MVRRTTLDVEPGLYVLRYESGSRRGASPLIGVSVPPRWSGVIELIQDHGSPPGELPAPGECLVIRAASAGQVEAVSRPSAPGGSLEAQLKLERLSRPAQELARVSAGEQRGPAGGVELLAHVARRGDVTAGPGEWIGGPSMPLPIEGIEIRATSPGPIPDVEYQVLTGLRQHRWSAWAPVGVFAGTRGRSLPVLGLRLRANEPGLRFEAEALFLGAAVMRRAGPEVELVGASGRDPLVGLAIRLVRSADLRRPSQTGSHVARERGRVFRATG